MFLKVTRKRQTQTQAQQCQRKGARRARKSPKQVVESARRTIAWAMTSRVDLFFSASICANMAASSTSSSAMAAAIAGSEPGRRNTRAGPDSAATKHTRARDKQAPMAAGVCSKIDSATENRSLRITILQYYHLPCSTFKKALRFSTSTTIVLGYSSTRTSTRVHVLSTYVYMYVYHTI